MITQPVKFYTCRECGTVYVAKYLPAVGNNRRHCRHCRRPLVPLGWIQVSDDLAPDHGGID